MVNYYIAPGNQYPLLLDAASRPYGPAVKASIYNGICRYLSDGGSGLPGKLLLPDEAQSYIDNDQALVSNWETTADMMLGGYNQGKSDAAAAWAQHKNCGGPDGAAIYFSCDFDEAPGQDAQIEQYLQGCLDQIGAWGKVGIYGSFYICQRVHAWNPNIYLWQTEAWSGGQVFDGIHLYQRNDLGYAWVGGCECDINEIRRPDDFGQWNIHLGGNTMSQPVSSQIENYLGVQVDRDFMLAWVDKREARNEQLLSAILDKLSGPGTAEALIAAFDKNVPDQFKG
ncbi:DUF1906 domain-containing protein [Nocardia jiangxiensis]|uniref:DUF1906 domain-containing protein n=1 Tax=Nocardia jiangxiensis TaxID=282685 RepID=UPI00031E0EB3|nr:DUF1906 domain-containing protein [Nocardia jiangxiensis]